MDNAEDNNQSGPDVNRNADDANKNTAAPLAPSFIRGEAAALSQDGRLRKTEEILKWNSLLAGGLGIIPIPLVDLAAVSAVQLKMLRDLTRFYGLENDEKLGKKVISALIGGLVPSTLGPAVGSMLKVVPLVGGIAGLLTQPAFSYASTYAVGKVFIRHFEQGGTLLTLDPKKEYAYQTAMFKEAIAAKNLKASGGS